MPLDPIHTIRAAKRLHLKDGCFVSFAPLGVFRGHLRAHAGRVVWTGASSAVERGEEVLEVWGKLVVPGLPAAGVDPTASALRGVAPAKRAAVRAKLDALPEDSYKKLAMQIFVECASAGVLHPIVDLRGATAAHVRATLHACAEIGLRGVLEWDAPTGADAAAVAEEARATRLAAVVTPLARKVSFRDAVSAGPDPAPGVLSIADSTPDVFALVRALELRKPGLGFECLAATYRVLNDAFRTPFGGPARGAWFDACFLDYEVPVGLDAATLAPLVLEGFGAWSIEAAAVGGQPVMKRHEVLTADREALARDVREIVAEAAA